MSTTETFTLGRVDLKTTVAAIREQEKLSDNDFPGLSYFDTSFEDRVRDTLTSEKTGQTFDYNPLLVTQLFTDITAILNRCLSYQRDYLGFEQSALQAARDYRAYDDQKDNQKKIERADYLVAVARKQKETAQGQAADVAQVLVDQLEIRAGYIDEKYVQLDKYYAALKKRHEIAGSSLNYKERATTLWTFLSADLKEGYLKVKAVAKGAAAVYGLSSFPPVPAWVHGDKPKTGEEGALGQLVMWTREMVRLINIEEEQYSDVFVTVPLKEGTTGAPSNISYGVMSGDEFKVFIKPSALAQGSFSLQAGIPQSMTNLRLYGVGLSYAMGTPDIPSFPFGPSRQVMSAVIFPPDVPPELGYANTVKRAPLIIGDVGLFDNNSNTKVEGSDDILNLDPLGYKDHSGWKIILSPTADTAVKEVMIRPDEINQIYLHLKLRCKLNRDLASWNFAKSHA